MHVRVRFFGKPDVIVLVESKLTKIEKFRLVLEDKFSLAPKLQRLFYGGKLLEDGYTFHDYNIKLNDVIQVTEQVQAKETLTDVKMKKELDEEDSVTKDVNVDYKDAESKLYAVGDLIDMREREYGMWVEGKIIRIVHDPLANQYCSMGTETTNMEITKEMHIETTDVRETEKIFNTDNDLENKPPKDINGEDSEPETPEVRKTKYIQKKGKKKDSSMNAKQIERTDENLLYKVQLDGEEEDLNLYCKLSEIRPRARTVIDVKDLKQGQRVMVNYNSEEPLETGHWYDFEVTDIQKLRTRHQLIGTIYMGPESVPQNDTKVCVREKIYAIEELVPLNQRTDEYIMKMRSVPEKRSVPLKCVTCRDDEDTKCKDCGCFICSGKEFPEKIILCDECDNGFHMGCLPTPLTAIPEEDWYCPSCKRDPSDVIAPGASKQTKKSSTKSNRDWGRGMACVGKTKTCGMPANHFGPIPGIEVGMCWRYRIQLSESGVHRPPVSGIHGRDVDGAYSLVLSGGYEDDVDYGIEFTYSGSGGRDLSGNKRTAEQSFDQILTRENKALARNCAVKIISPAGGDAGENWRDGKPVRVVRSYKMLKHSPEYAPKEGVRYDGIYKVVKYYPEKGLSGYVVWKYLLRRDDPSPAPWEPNAKQFNIVYPDGHLEAEAEKKALKEKKGKWPKQASKASKSKKRVLRDSNHTSGTETEPEASPPVKKRKVDPEPIKKEKQTNLTTNSKSPKAKIQTSITQHIIKSPPKPAERALSEKQLEAIKADTLNAKGWEECLKMCEKQSKKEVVEHVTQMFFCIICQEVAASPVTTPCLHNFCLGCLKHAFKATGTLACPCCRHNLSKYEPEQNEPLKLALRSILPGYDAGKR